MTQEELGRYRWIRNERDQLKQRIEALRDQSEGVSVIDGMPHGHSTGRRSEQQIIDRDFMVNQYVGLSNRLTAEMFKIERVIEGLEPRERMLFRYRYIDCMTMEEIAAVMCYSERQCWNILNDGLEKLKE